jgi:DNA repair exonuclease SbcCD ATPase subunit
MTIRGPNESGKTTIGEAISFALFGRTLRLDASERAEVIRWSQESAEVVLEFEVAPGEAYRIRRRVDRAGGYVAVLESLEEGGVVLAEGPGEVDEQLPAFLGFDFEAFRYAFYLGQKEVDLLLGSAEEGGALERMTGVEALEGALARARDEAQDLGDKAREAELRIRLQEELLEELARGGVELEETRDEIASAREAADEARARVEEVEAAQGGSDEVVGARRRVQAMIDRVRLIALSRSLAGRIHEVEKKAEAAREASAEARKGEEEALSLQREHRMFSDSLAELEEFVKARGVEISGTGDAKRERPKRADKSASFESETERLQRLVRERETSLDKERRLHKDLEEDTGSSKVWLVGGVAIGPILALSLQDPRWFLTLPIAGMAYLILQAQRARAGDAATRISRAEGEILSLQDELGRVRKIGKACDRFLARNKATLLEGLRAIGSDSLHKMAERLEERFPQFWNAPETFQEGYGGVLQEAVEQRRAAFDEALASSREAASVAEGARGRLESLVRLAQVPKPSSSGLSGVSPEGLEESITDDLELGEKLLLAVEARGDNESGDALANRSAINQAFDLLDAGGETARPDCEGFFRLLRGNEPPGLSRSDDPWPWAQQQGELVGEFLAATGSEEAAPEVDPAAMAAAREELARAEAGLAILEKRADKLERDKPGAAPEERRGQMARLQKELETLRHDQQVREVLAEMLAATVQRVRSRLFPEVAAYAARLLPRITGGRHGDVRISTEGALQVYAPEAGEYVGLDSLSGGARDQLLLALRLAFAGAVVRSRAPEAASHFLFLDEPLASSDEERGRAFLELLEDRGEAFRQVFLVTHRPQEGEGTGGAQLGLSLDATEVVADMSATASSAPPMPEAVEAEAMADASA